MNDFADLLERDRRLATLRVLEESPRYTANQYLMRSALEGCGHYVGVNAVAGDFSWLAAAGLVRCDSVEGVVTATLTDFGMDVATGRSTVSGVAKLEPGRR